MTHDIPSEGRPSAVTGQPETPVASRVDERDCSRPAAAAPGAAEGISAAPGISPADHPLGVETPEQAARYWQMRHADAQIELAKATRCILELQAEVVAAKKGHQVALRTLSACHEVLDQAKVPSRTPGIEVVQDRIRFLAERAAKPVHVAPPPADTASCEQHLQERIEELEAELKAARAEIADVHRGLDATGVYAQVTTLSGQRLLSPRERIDRLTARAVELADCINAPASNVGVYGRMAQAICGVTYGGIGLRRTLVEKIMANGAEAVADDAAASIWQDRRTSLILDMARPHVLVMPASMRGALRSAYLGGVRAGAYQALQILDALGKATNAAEQRAEGRGDAEGGEVPA